MSKRFIKVPVTDVSPGDVVLYAEGISEKVKGVSTDVDEYGCMACNDLPGTTTIELWLNGFAFPITFIFLDDVPTVEVYR